MESDPMSLRGLKQRYENNPKELEKKGINITGPGPARWQQAKKRKNIGDWLCKQQLVCVIGPVFGLSYNTVSEQIMFG